MHFRLLSAISRGFGARRAPERLAAENLFEKTVEAARRPAFFADYGVPDTVEGRFDMLTIHVFLVLRRLRGQPAAERFSQGLFDAMFQNMDDSLREMGVGDLRVGKKVRELAEMFYGRSAAYEAAITEGEDALATVVRRNVFGAETDAEESVTAGAAAIAAYMSSCVAAFDDYDVEAFTRAGIDFPPVPPVG